MNPYDSSDKFVAATPPKVSRWPLVVATCACLYYGISAITLPFTNAVWIGEIPLLAILQIPKSFLKSIAQNFLLEAVRALGVSHGSASPDYTATHGLAMLIMTVAPALLLVCFFKWGLRERVQNRMTVAVVVFATIDAVITIWFDSSSSTKLYNASYF